MEETTIASEEVAANEAAEKVAEIAKEVVKEIVKEVEHVTVQRVDNGFIIVCPTRKHKIANNIKEVIAIISADFAA